MTLEGESGKLISMENEREIMLIKMIVKGVDYVPLWRKVGLVGWKCPLVMGTNKRCMVCK